MLFETITRMRRYGGAGAEVLLVLSEAMTGYWRELCEKYEFESPEVVAGGATRWESVKRALEHPLAAEAAIITVHDGARPVVTGELMKRVMDLKRQGNIPGVAVTDSLRIIDGDDSKSVDRSLFRAVQTPQAFRGDLLRKAYNLPYDPSFTDDASVMEAAGFDELDIVEGDAANIKITRPGDIEIAALYLSRSR